MSFTTAAVSSAWDVCSVMAVGTSTFIDMTVFPDHQRRGLGDAVLSALRECVRGHGPAGAYVNLLADRPGRRLCERHGFRDTATGSIGMARRLDGAP